MPPTIDFKRELRGLYGPGRDPAIIDVPELGSAMIDGHGNPDVAPAYREAVQALYAVAYTIRFALKRAPHGHDFSVMPLEGLWWVTDMSRFTSADKSTWDWTMMIMQPDWVTSEVFDTAQATASRKKPALEAITDVRLERLAEGRAAQLLYRGPYADEGPTIQRLHAFIADEGFEPTGKHHEIYLGDPSRTAPEKLKTIIRQPIAAR
jgi:hypothetical protein